MQSSQWEVVVLKPTRVFLSFLASQLPGIELPALKSMQLDNTAYIINRQKDDEATLNEIERHFAVMFRHEIARWLGKDARNDIKGSFLDFLCCFKFELHTQILLMEDSLAAGKQLLKIKPRSVLLDWMRSSAENQGEVVNLLNKINLSLLTENATVIVKNFQHVDDIQIVIEEQYKLIFQAEMLRMNDLADQWPRVDSHQDFTDYFSVNVHSQLIHLYE